MNLKTGTVEGEADNMETVSCAFFLLCLILYMSGWSDVENEQQSGANVENERAEWMWRISDEDIYLRLAKKMLLCVFVLY